MVHRMIFWCCFITQSLVAAAQDLSNAPNIGTSAPLLFINQWIKGPPIDSFEHGTLYVVEFTHLNCVPCREMIPHLSSLEKKYSGLVKVLSIYSYFPSDKVTEEDYHRKIAEYIDEMGTMPVYTIALDTRQRSSYLAWETQKTGFPSLFLIDHTGRIAWKGFSSEALDHAINQLLMGKLDKEREIKKSKTFESLSTDVYLLYKAGKKRECFALLDSLKAIYPEEGESLDYLLFRCMAFDDATGANALMDKLLAKNPMFRSGLNFFGRNVNSLKLNLGLGVELANRVLRYDTDPKLRSKSLINLALLHLRYHQYQVSELYLIAANQMLKTGNSMKAEIDSFLYLVRWCQKYDIDAHHALKLLTEDINQNRIGVIEATVILHWAKSKLRGELISRLSKIVGTL